ncbi:ABC transporter ATP-binding protein [Desulforhopalus vacuolatus]|uniref:ABC transporter ATP-binding protein n=1 Tax=Desulforhopalus vacuolatus TaxID=40414 RepID=UPI0019631069|nr:ABC transporter ATP-binding protein [Desulforhopalus vacuolatus]MBM9519509.1 ABC transporter ATP-binding protein [Desulforhopalus vacuolatus]
MSSDAAISVENLSKCYQIYNKPGDRLKQMIMRGRRSYYKEFWALRDVSFTIGRGETVGIVGQNGCGKSTLLQMVCGTLNPTAGKCQTRGRIAALLELGSGFNPEFTGRENVYMNASVLGLTSAEIDSRFAAITDFANIGDFIEQPVKTYSSGMMVRLAFAVAINVDPEILIVDEALAVGDELFQRKCFSRLEEIRRNGATILFVSHSVGVVVELCDRAILLDRGEKLTEGTPKYVTGRYQKLIYAAAERREEIRQTIVRETEECHVDGESEEEREEVEEKAREEMEELFEPDLKPSSTISYDSKGCWIKNPGIYTLGDIQVNNLVSGRTYKYCYEVSFNRPASHVCFGMMIKTISGVELGGSITDPLSNSTFSNIKEDTTCKIVFSFTCNLSPGVYFLNAGVTGEIDGDTGFLHRLLDVAMFRVLPLDHESRITGTVDFSCSGQADVVSKS